MSRKISMRKLRELIRLKFDCQLSHRQIARSLNISPSTVSYYARAAIEAKLNHWPLAEELEDARLKEELEPRCKQIQCQKSMKAPFDMEVIYKQLQHKGVTLQLLWQEYKTVHKENSYSYGYLCRHYQTWKKKTFPVMRQSHEPGRCLYVDYAGQEMTLVNSDTGERTPVKIFVGAMGVSQKIYAEGTMTRSLPDWIGSHVRNFEFLGAIPVIVIPDNEKSGVHKASSYDPDLNPTYHDMLLHYDTCAVPTRPRKPKDKPKVENAVLQVERWVIAPLRHRTFFSLKEMNEAIQEKVDELNNRPYQQQEGTRNSQFESMDKPSMKPLPKEQYIYATFSQTTVGLDYHIRIDEHYYSVPYKWIKERVTVRLSHTIIEVFHQHKRIAMHPRNFQKQGTTTCSEHMPKAHQKHQEWTPQLFTQWASVMGQQILKMAERIIHITKHPERSYRMHLGLKRLVKLYGAIRVEKACLKANQIGIYRFEQLQSMLKHKLDTVDDIIEPEQSSVNSHHLNIRGNQYFH